MTPFTMTQMPELQAAALRSSKRGELPLPSLDAPRLGAPRLGVPNLGPDDDKDGKGGKNEDGGGKFETGTTTKTRPKTKRPSLYRVLLLNDDYTPMEFVVLVLQDVFNKSREDAMKIMLHVHQQGVGECGVFPFEVAETKVTRVMDTARKNQHPLQCVMEKQ